MAPRPYTNEDIRAFSYPLCRPGATDTVGFIGKVHTCRPGDSEPQQPHLTLLRTWYWIDEPSGLLGQTNVSSSPIRPDFLPRRHDDGSEPGHFQKQFEWPWPHMTPGRLHENVRVRRKTAVKEGTSTSNHEARAGEGGGGADADGGGVGSAQAMDGLDGDDGTEAAAEVAEQGGDDRTGSKRPSTFASHTATVGAYVVGAGPDGGINTYLGVPGATQEARARVPEGGCPPPGSPWPLEFFIKDGAGCRWAGVVNYDTASGCLNCCWLTKELQLTVDPAQRNVLEAVGPQVPPRRGLLPADSSDGWGLPRGSTGSATCTWVGEEGLLLTEEGLEAVWQPPEEKSLPPGHVLLRMVDETYLLCPLNNIALPPGGGPLLYEFGARNVYGGGGGGGGRPEGQEGGGGRRGFRRVCVRFEPDGLLQEVRYERFDNV
ncbi:hypothetical protein HYH02_004740 [Chlamydomonas schloesseri]|uniref:Uncharacterized protein n=1 Tax=Chlamydomonas schloesseri TaxID=2026947 RepID=A0A836B8S4_9CHLO|nr:hypothetical protein HYH02_004740 [Chlamydomonas schloesseri]|eukprot:KAG2450908.1 hypothetical protein HYH02_004740 [Chlamydomonas schloesseri]